MAENGSCVPSIPDPAQIREVRRGSDRLSEPDEIAEFLVQREKEPSKQKKYRLGKAAKGIRIDPAPASKVSAQVDLDSDPERIRVRVSYEGNAAKIPHEKFRDIPKGQKYYRDGTRYQRVDRGAFDGVESAAQDLGGEETDEGYSFPAFLFEEIINQFGRLGFIEQGVLFSRWLEKLLDFEKVESNPLPKALKAEWQPRSEDGKPAGIRPYQQKAMTGSAF